MGRDPSRSQVRNVLRLDSEPLQSESPYTTYLSGTSWTHPIELPRPARRIHHRFRCKLAVRSVQDDVTNHPHCQPIDCRLEGVQRFQRIPCSAPRCFRSRSLRHGHCSVACVLKQLCQFLDVPGSATPTQARLFLVRFSILISGRCPRPTRPNSFTSNSEVMIVCRVTSSSLPAKKSSPWHPHMPAGSLRSRAIRTSSVLS